MIKLKFKYVSQSLFNKSPPKILQNSRFWTEWRYEWLRSKTLCDTGAHVTKIGTDENGYIPSRNSVSFMSLYNL